MKLAVLAGLGALWCACSAPAPRVTIRRPAPVTPGQAERLKQISTVYVIATQPPIAAKLRNPDSIMSAGMQRAARNAALYPDTAWLAEQAAQVFLRAGSLDVRYRLSDKPDAPDPYLSIFRPAAVFRVYAAPLKITQTKKVQTIVEKDKDGKEKKVEKAIWAYSVKGSVHCRLQTQANGKALAEFDYPISKEEVLNFARDPALWYGGHERKLFADFVNQVVDRFSVPVIEIHRNLLEVKNPASGEWQASWNAAAKLEAQGRYVDALARYSEGRKQAEAAGQPQAAPWAVVIEEVRRAATLPAAPNAPPWFAGKIAVMPFTDNTASVDAPVVTRRMIQSALTRGGYDLIALDVVDRILREQGFTQGGQLKAGKNEDFAKWLSADALLFGHIEMYQPLPIPTVSGNLNLWDAKSAAVVWSGDASGINEGVSGWGILSRYKDTELSQMMRWSTLVGEADWFTRYALATLPLKAQLP